MHIEFFTAFPPSVNNYYVKTRVGVRISAKGKKFRQQLIDSVTEQIQEAEAEGRCLVEIVLWPPCNRRRDVDNFIKATFDAMTHAEVWGDDSQVDQLLVYRGVTSPGHGMIGVRITEAGPLLPVGTMPPMD